MSDRSDEARGMWVVFALIFAFAFVGGGLFASMMVASGHSHWGASVDDRLDAICAAVQCEEETP